MENFDYETAFKSYREYVGMCLEANEEIPTFSEFIGRKDN